jgi:hypothetical protein
MYWRSRDSESLDFLLRDFTWRKVLLNCCLCRLQPWLLFQGQIQRRSDPEASWRLWQTKAFRYTGDGDGQRHVMLRAPLQSVSFPLPCTGAHHRIKLLTKRHVVPSSISCSYSAAQLSPKNTCSSWKITQKPLGVKTLSVRLPVVFHPLPFRNH